MTDETGAGKYWNEVPKSPRSACDRYWKYWSSSGASESPIAARTPAICSGFIWLAWPRMIAAGSPGRSRGRTKSRVRAAQNAAT